MSVKLVILTKGFLYSFVLLSRLHRWVIFDPCV